LDSNVKDDSISDQELDQEDLLNARMVTTFSCHHITKSTLISNSSSSTAILRQSFLQYGNTMVWKSMLKEHQTILDYRLESMLDGGISSNGKHHTSSTRKERSWILLEERTNRMPISL
jgi:hypothetical protein